MMKFLDQAGWGHASAKPLAGDASTRQYQRLSLNGKSAIMMQDSDGDVDLFARLSRHLTGLGLSAPLILAQAPGLLLLEDLGDGLIANLASDPDMEKILYLTAVDALLELHQHPAPPDIPIASPQTLAQMTDLAFDCYAAGAGADGSAYRDQAITAFIPILEKHGAPCNVMIMRDYHAENILWLPDRKGAAKAGLLDFQDALVGHRAYDLISLIEDARRDVRPATAKACIDHYLANSSQGETGFRTSLSVLGAQRNLRILGVFARLAATRGKPHYVDLIPRVWAHLQTDLQHPALAPIKSILDKALPPPTPDVLQRLKSLCPTP
ncbi:phosphotransferase [uncultured Pelagimonas sp.]|uniref:aminoglycoside phosphotransferase family protein n=1 Tax=uncultured Pelagimonas sp. TaxID=1618102 RepID=UPI0034581CEA